MLGAPPSVQPGAVRPSSLKVRTATMAEPGDVPTDPDTPRSNGGGNGSGNGSDTQPMAGLISQYVKDLSVENPRAPDSFQWTDPPQLDVQFNIGARRISDEVTEIELKVVATAKATQGTLYIVDLSYCGLVGMRNMTDEHKHAFTYAEGPRILFPFARRVIGDAVRDAGFPPLLLDPIDFNGLYLQQLQQQGRSPAGGQPGETGDGG